MRELAKGGALPPGHSGFFQPQSGCTYYLSEREREALGPSLLELINSAPDESTEES